MPHNIPSTTRKINTTIAGEQHSLFQKRKHSRSAADGKCAQSNLHEAQADAEAVAFSLHCPRCYCCGVRQRFQRTKCHRASTNKVLCHWEMTPDICRWRCLASLFASVWQPRFCDVVFLPPCEGTAEKPSPRSVQLSDLCPPCLAGYLGKKKTCCFLTRKILRLISDLLTFSFPFKVYSTSMTWPADCKIHI